MASQEDFLKKKQMLTGRGKPHYVSLGLGGELLQYFMHFHFLRK